MLQECPVGSGANLTRWRSTLQRAPTGPVLDQAGVTGWAPCDDRMPWRHTEGDVEQVAENLRHAVAPSAVAPDDLSEIGAVGRIFGDGKFHGSGPPSSQQVP
jgi:hypothetical protein